MRPIHSERLRWWGIGALALLLVHGLGVARPAWAGCNHLVVSKSDRLIEFQRLDALIVGDGSSALVDEPTSDPLSEQRPGRPGPCAGPGCSSRVPVPVSTTSQGPDGSDQWVLLGAVLRLAIASPSCRTIDEPAGRPTGQKPSVFHPPPA